MNGNRRTTFPREIGRLAMLSQTGPSSQANYAIRGPPVCSGARLPRFAFEVGLLFFFSNSWARATSARSFPENAQSVLPLYTYRNVHISFSHKLLDLAVEQPNHKSRSAQSAQLDRFFEKKRKEREGEAQAPARAGQTLGPNRSPKRKRGRGNSLFRNTLQTSLYS